MKPLWIIVDDGHVFEGHQLHWANCFFSNAVRASIEAFLNEPGAAHSPDERLHAADACCKYVIREMTDEELAKYPEAVEFCKQLVEEYGEM